MLSLFIAFSTQIMVLDMLCIIQIHKFEFLVEYFSVKNRQKLGVGLDCRPLRTNYIVWVVDGIREYSRMR